MPPTTKLSIKQLKQSEETTIQNRVNLKNNNFRIVSLRFVSFHFISFQKKKKKQIDHRYITCYILWVLHRIFYLYKIRATCSARIHCIHFDSFIDWRLMFSFLIFFSSLYVSPSWNLELYYLYYEMFHLRLFKVSIYLYVSVV